VYGAWARRWRRGRMRGRVDGHKGTDARPGATRLPPLCIAAWAWAWARCGHAARPWVRHVSDTLLPCVSSWHWGVRPAYRNVSTKKEKTRLNPSRVRGHPARPSRSPSHRVPVHPSIALAARMRPACPHRPARQSRRRRAVRAPVVSLTRCMRACPVGACKEKAQH